MVPPRRCDQVGVEKNNIREPFCGCYGAVIAFGEAVVLGESHDLNFFSKSRSHVVERAISAAVIGHNKARDGRVSAFCNPGKVFAQKCFAVPVEDYYSDAGSVTGFFHLLWVHSHMEGVRWIVS